jgi:hypothetical protein
MLRAFCRPNRVAFLDANPKGARQVRRPPQSLRLRPPKRHRGLHLRVFEMDCAIGLPAQNPCVLGSLVATSLGNEQAPERRAASLTGRPRWSRRPVGPSRKPRTQRLPASPTAAGRHACTANTIQAPFAATGDDDGQLHEPNTTEVSAWGGLNERLTMLQESACRPAVRRAAERSCEQSGGETRVGGIGLVAGGCFHDPYRPLLLT